ncbi:MAG: GNAT family N-acetyltransferase [Thermoguttaceae bacterium]|jgi:GNAT superfamily N-acetyltransferase
MNCSPDINIRQFKKSDLNAVRELILSTINTCYAGFYPPRAIEYFKQYHCDANILERAEKGYTIIVESNGRVVATGTIVENHVCAVFIIRSVQRQGLGRKIMEHLEDRAISEGFKEINLDVSLPSRQFYERLGYRLSEDTHIDVGEGQSLDYWKAHKPLPAGKS